MENGFLYRIFHSFKKILTLFSGNSIGQLITLLAAPVLSRIYTPEEFGVLSIFLAIGQILIVFVSMGYEVAIVLPKTDSAAIQLVKLCFRLSLVFSILLYCPLIIFKNYIIQLLDSASLYKYLYLLPVYVYFGGIFGALNNYNIRLSNFINIAKSTIIKNLSNVFIQVILGVLKFGPIGLLSGQISMNIFGNIQLYKEYLKSSKENNVVPKDETFKALMHKYKNFPKYYVWGALSNSISLNIPNIFVNKLYSLKQVGFYSYAFKYIGFPISLLGTSIGQVYTQEMSEDIRNNKGWETYYKTIIKLLFIGIPVFILLYLIIEPLFSFLFGYEWYVAGVYGKILIPLFFIRFIVSPLSMSLVIIEKQQYVFTWQVGLLLLTILQFIIAKVNDFSIENYLSSYVYIIGFYYVVYLFIITYVVYKKTHICKPLS